MGRPEFRYAFLERRFALRQCVNVLRSPTVHHEDTVFIRAAELIVRIASLRHDKLPTPSRKDGKEPYTLPTGVLCIDSQAAKCDINGVRIVTEPGLNPELLGDPAQLFAFRSERDPSPRQIRSQSYRQVERWTQNNLNIYVAHECMEDGIIRSEDEI